MGRPRKPVKIKILAGNPGKRPLGEEPEPPAFVGDAPGHLAGIARERWIVLSKLLGELGIFTQADTGVLEAYCTAYASFREASDELKKKGQVIKTSYGPARNPWANAQKDAYAMMERSGSKLGLSPADRAKLAHDPGDGEGKEDDEEFFGKSAKRGARRPEASA